MSESSHRRQHSRFGPSSIGAQRPRIAAVHRSRETLSSSSPTRAGITAKGDDATGRIPGVRPAGVRALATNMRSYASFNLGKSGSLKARSRYVKYG